MTERRRNIPDIAKQGFDGALSYKGHNPLDVMQPVYEEFHDKMYRDSLTGLLGRDGFVKGLEYLRDSRSEGDPDPILAIGMIDVDRFKAVNDGYGHPVGDETLVALAGIISSCLREGDTVARWGGDEFAVSILLHHNLKRANVSKGFDLELQNRLQEAVEAGNNKPLGLIGLSMGMEICRLSELKDHLGEIINRADARMYESKKKSALLVRGGRAAKTGKVAVAGKVAVGSSRRAGDKTTTHAKSA